MLALLVGVSVALAWPYALKPVTQHLPPALVVAVALFIMAWTMPSQHLGHELRRPWAAGWALFVSYGVLPTLAWLAGGLSPTPDLRVGLMLAASVPCTLASCVLWTRLAGGNEATALVAVLGCTLLSWFITPLWLTFAAATESRLDGVEIMRTLALTLVVPVALGQALRLAPVTRHFANRRKAILTAVAQCFVLAIMLRTAADVGARLHAGHARVTVLHLAETAALAAAVHLAALFFGVWSGRRLGIDRGRSIAIAFCGSQKTLPVSALLFDRYFQADYPLAVAPLLFFHVGQLLFDTAIANRWKRLAAAAAEP